MSASPASTRFRATLAAVPPVVRALTVQGVAAAAVLALLPGAPPLASAAAAGAGAAALGQLAGLRPWWLVINAIFPVLALLALRAQLPPWVYLAGFGGLVAVFGLLPRTRVPLYLAQPAVAEALAPLLPAHGAMVDLGCGFAGIPARLSRCEGARCVGVELGPLPWLVSKLRSLGRGEAFDVRYADLWKVYLAGFDLVYVFLSPEVMPRLWAKAAAEMREGAWLASYAFDIPGVAPTRTIPPAAAGGRPLYLWQMGGAPRIAA